MQGRWQRPIDIDLARSSIAMAVKAGAPSPDISSVEALKQAFLHAKSVAYSDSASGVYIQNQLFKTMGIAEQMQGRARMIPAEPVGLVVARGEAELGFQQLSELKPIPGITVVGLLPEGAQQVTVFSAGVLGTSAHQGGRPRPAWFFVGARSGRRHSAQRPRADAGAWRLARWR